MIRDWVAVFGDVGEFFTNSATGWCDGMAVLDTWRAVRLRSKTVPGHSSPKGDALVFDVWGRWGSGYSASDSRVWCWELRVYWESLSTRAVVRHARATLSEVSFYGPVV